MFVLISESEVTRMKIAGLLLLVFISLAMSYMETGAGENRLLGSMPFKTLVFLRKISPYGSSAVERPLPFGAHKRLDSEEKFSPFHSILVIRKHRTFEDPLSTKVPISKSEAADSFIKDFLVSHLQHTNAMEDSGFMNSSKQYNTEKIYNDLYNIKAPRTKSSHKKPSQILGDEIDSIMENAAKELSTPEPEEQQHNSSIGKTIKKTKKRFGKKFKKAKGAIRKGMSINGYTILLFTVISLVSGVAGYTLRGRSSIENFVPLSK